MPPSGVDGVTDDSKGGDTDAVDSKERKKPGALRVPSDKVPRPSGADAAATAAPDDDSVHRQETVPYSAPASQDDSVEIAFDETEDDSTAHDTVVDEPDEAFDAATTIPDIEADVASHREQTDRAAMTAPPPSPDGRRKGTLQGASAASPSPVGPPKSQSGVPGVSAVGARVEPSGANDSGELLTDEIMEECGPGVPDAERAATVAEPMEEVGSGEIELVKGEPPPAPPPTAACEETSADLVCRARCSQAGARRQTLV